MTTVIVTEEILAVNNEIVETITITTAEQGPPGPAGLFAPDGIDVISGGLSSTDFSDGYIFEGGAP